MTYATGNVIEASDYNFFANGNAGVSVSGIWSTGSSDVGYGQTAIANVSAGSTVTATQWASLFNTLSNIGAHQGTTITNRTSAPNLPVAGNVIAALANVNTDITNCYNNAANAVAQGTEYGTFSGSVSKTSATGSGSSAWSITFTSTVQFANASAARYFFNSGGTVKWQTNKTSDSTAADTEWNDLASNLTGNIIISAGLGNSYINGVNYTGTYLTGNGTPAFSISPTQGFYNFSTTPSTVYLHYADTSPYTGQYIRLQCSVDTTPNPTALILTTLWSDPGGSGPGSSDDISGGTATTSPSTTITGTAPTTLVTYTPPSTTYLTNTWGTPTITSSVT